MPQITTDRLADVARRFGTPAYFYDWPTIAERTKAVNSAFAGLMSVSYAVKANPNAQLLTLMRDCVGHFDVSSAGEFARVRRAGVAPSDVSFTGPGKRDAEINTAVAAGIGHIVCESIADLQRAHEAARQSGRTQDVLVRINPQQLPPKFGAHMGGGASQFGIDEESVAEVLHRHAEWPALRLAGFHVYSGSNCLNIESLERHFALTIALFDRLAAELPELPRTLVVGSGFGVPYHDGDSALDFELLCGRLRPLLSEAATRSRLRSARWFLEMGRYLVAEGGWLLTSVLDVKNSRGTQIAILDAGFNNHLAAAGLMGSVLRRNWPITALTADGPASEYTLVGPLCTSIDTLGTRVRLPALAPGDVLAIAASGAYGLTASPRAFISHPDPPEIIQLADGKLIDASEDFESFRIGASTTGIVS